MERWENMEHTQMNNAYKILLEKPETRKSVGDCFLF
jgi:hypothetical protein